LDSLLKTGSHPDSGGLRPHFFPVLSMGTPPAGAAPDPACGFRPGFAAAGEDRLDSLSSRSCADPEGQAEAVEIAALENAAWRRGQQDGYQQGLDAGRREAAPMIKQFRQALSDLQSVRTQLLCQAEKDVVHLAISVARKIVLREPSVSPDLVLAVVKAALAKVADQDRIIIRVNPMDLKAVQAHDPALDQWVERHGTLAIVADSHTGLGGCQIETDFGDVDARLEKQLEVIETAFNEQLGIVGPYR
jgi:flagellar assembly protein FliH